MVDQTAAQVKAAQAELANAGVEADESKTEEAQQDSGEDRKIEAPKPEMVGGVPKVRWDNPDNDPTKRKSIAQDPTGVENRKLLADNE